MVAYVAYVAKGNEIGAGAEAWRRTENGPIVDWLKWAVVATLVVAGIVGNWYYADYSLLVRALALVAVAAAAGYTAAQTERGQRVLVLVREARAEIRRVVWPTRQEATQTTVMVLILIMVFSLILWGLDSLLSWGVQGVIG